jgi:Na+-driven multidrug efflux pump
MKQREVFLFWLPLFASWLLMTAEGPLLSTAINRLPNEVVMLAALGIVFSIAVTIESPVINLLATATALVRDRGSYLQVRRFTLHWIVFLLVTGGLIAFTPLFDLVVLDWLGTPPEVAHWVRPGLRILLLWSPAIAWRRFLQGVLIRYGHTRAIARGTVLRLLAMALVVFACLWVGDIPGIYLATWAMLAGVVVEAIYASIIARPVIARELTVEVAEGREALTYRRLFWFHLPLAATAAFNLLAQPLVSLTLARLDEPTLSLAAWPLVFQAALVIQSPAFALPEVVIALGDRSGGEATLVTFTRRLAIVTSGAMVLLVATPLLGFYLGTIQDATPAVAALARQGLLLFVPLPALAVVSAWLRGLLIHRGATRTVNEATVLNLLVIGSVLGLGLHLRWPGIEITALAVIAAWIVQMVFLWWRWRTRDSVRL